MMLSLEVGTMELGTLVSTAGAWSYESLRISRDLVAFAVSHCITIITITIIITIIIIIKKQRPTLQHVQGILDPISN